MHFSRNHNHPRRLSLPDSSTGTLGNMLTINGICRNKKCLKRKKISIITKIEKEKQFEFLSSDKEVAQNGEVDRW